MSAEQLIAEHIALWTSSVKAKNTQGRGSSKKRELYGIKKLRELILELAVRGKLVPQNKNEESASELLERIAADKIQLLKKNEIKKQKPLPEISKEEQHITLPAGWEVERLGILAKKITDGSHNPPRDAGEGYPMLSGQNINFGSIDFNHPSRYVNQEDFKREALRTAVTSGDVLLTIVGSIGRSAVVPAEFPKFVLQRSVAVIQSLVKPEYLSLHFSAPISLRYFEENAKGTAQKGIYLGQLSQMLILVPPLQEQHRIVAKVDELMALCDQLEQETESSLDAHNLLVDTLLSTLTDALDADELSDNWARLADHFDTLITTDYAVEQLKQHILDLAILGKLVEQDHNDEPAQKVLARVLAQREKVTKEFRLNRPVELDSKLESFQPLSSGWCYSTPDQLTAFDRNSLTIGPFGSNLLKSDYQLDGTPLIFVRDIRRETFGGDDTRFVSKEKAEELASHSVQPGDLLITKMGAPPGDTAIYSDGRPTGIITADCIKLTPHTELVSSEYLRYAVRADIIVVQLLGITMGVAQKKVSLARFRSIAVPIPPVAEQHRIVAKVDELMDLCDQLNNQLSRNQSTQLHLTDAIVENAIAN